MLSVVLFRIIFNFFLRIYSIKKIYKINKKIYCLALHER